MPDKNFEESVRQKMDELDFRPSDAVWSRIEAELPDKRRRRVLVFWMPIASSLLLLIYAGQQYFIEKRVKSENAQVTKFTPQDQQDNRNGTPGKGAIVDPAPRQPSFSTDQSLIKEENESVKQQPLVQYRNKNIVTKASDPANDSLFQTSEIRANDEPWTLLEEMRHANNYIEVAQLSALPQVQRIELTNNEKHGKDLIAGLTINNSPVVINAKNSRKPVDKSPKWNFYGAVGAGIAGMNNGGILDLHTATVADYQSAIPAYSNINRAPIYSASNINPGLFYSVQINAERALSRNWSASAGIGYSRFNTSMEVGWQKRKLNMHHDLIDIPVRVSYRYRAVTFNVGLIGSQMIASQTYKPSVANGFGYDRVQEVRQMQWGITAGADLRVLKKTGQLIKVGPVFRYQFTNLYKSTYAEQHLGSGAINIKWYLKN